MRVDGKDVPVGPGDVVLVPAGARHGFRNAGESPLKLMIMWGKPE